MPAHNHADLSALLERVRGLSELDELTAAHLTAFLLVPGRGFVTVAPITGETRVCVTKGSFTNRDIVWSDWPTWQTRWKIGPINDALTLVERVLPDREPQDVLHDALERMGREGWRSGQSLLPQIAQYVVIELLETLIQRASDDEPR